MFGKKEDDAGNSNEGGSIIHTVQNNCEDSNHTVTLDFTSMSVQKHETSYVSGIFSAGSSISPGKVLMSHLEGYDDPISTKFNAPELPQANLFERLWQRTDKKNGEFVRQQQVVVPKPNSSVSDSGYSTCRTVGQSTVYSQVGSIVTACYGALKYTFLLFESAEVGTNCHNNQNYLNRKNVYFRAIVACTNKYSG